MLTEGGGRVVQRCRVNFQCRGVLLIWITVGQGPIRLAVGADGGCLDILSLIYHFSFLSPFLWETSREGPVALAIGAGGGCLDIFPLVYLF